MIDRDVTEQRNMMRTTYYLGILTGIFFACIFIIFLVTVLPARAHDAARPELDTWYQSLHSGRGPCCGGPKEDATQLEELQWERDAQGYRVFVRGEWVRVPDDAVVPVPNREGRALVWYGYVDGHPVVRCFLPGDLT